MELLLPLIALGLTVALPVTLIFLTARVAKLTRRLDRVEAQLRIARTQAQPPALSPGPQELPPPPIELGQDPAEEPADRPTDEPTDRPTDEPTDRPTDGPTDRPTEEPPPLPTPVTRSRPRVPTSERTTTSIDAPHSHRPAGPPKSFRPSEIEWERWLGIRGAAVVGGIALILAGFFFVKDAIDRGWLGPAARDTLAFFIGAIALASHSPLIKRGYRPLGESIGGAGAVLIYGAAWAAARLHGIVPEWLALLVMTATTGAALVFSIRSSAPILASFALVGGFATPLLLNTFDQGATTLFGYVLVLDLALLAIARIRNWIWMLPLAAVGTTIIQVTWIVVQGNALDPWVSTLVLGGFALTFTVSRATARGDSAGRGLVHVTLLLAVFAPLVLTSMRTGAPAPGQSLWSQAILLGVLVSCAAVASRRFKSPADAIVAAIVAAMSLALAATQLRIGATHPGAPPQLDSIWAQWAISAVALAGLHLVLLRVGTPRSATFAFVLVSLLLAHAMTVVGESSDVPRSFVLTVAVLAAIGIASCKAADGLRVRGALLGAAAGFTLMAHAYAVHGEPLPYGTVLTASIPALGVVALAGAMLLPRGAAQAGGSMAGAARAFAAFIVVLPLLMLSDIASGLSTPIHATILITAGVAAAIALQRAGRWTPAALFAQCGAAAVLLLAWSDQVRVSSSVDGEVSLALAIAITCMVPPIGLLLARALDGRKLEAAAWAVILPAATLAFGPAQAVMNVLGAASAFHGVILATAAGTLASGVFLDRRKEMRPAAAVLLAAAVALMGVSLSRYGAAQWTVTATAIAGGSFAFFCGRARSTGAAGLGAALASATALILVALTLLEGAFLTEPLYVPLQVTFDHGLIVASLVAAAIGLSRLPASEPARRPLYVAVVVSLLVLLFAWVNAVVLNHFATGDRIRMEFERMQARDLTLSLSWAVFGATLLGAGLARRIPGLRWASLAVLIATVLKVFLYDLGALTGMSRVGSFLGLAVCLLGVSMLYARVLGRDSGSSQQ